MSASRDFINSDEAKQKTSDELFAELKSSREGLSSSEVSTRRAKCGLNTIREKKESSLLKLLGYFWGPIPWMIEIAAILSIIGKSMPDFYIILTLLVVNGLVGFWEEYQAGNAIAVLKKQLAAKCIVKREGKWEEMNAEELVPGDLILLKLGNIIPADAKLVDGEYLVIDQSTLTGESLPITKKTGEIAFSGSIAKQGEMAALVTATGENTFFGKTTKLVEKAKPTSHFQKAVLQIGDYLIYISSALAVLLIAVQLLRGDSLLQVVQFVLVLVIASIPVALPAVLSVTMALGALKLSRMKAIVTKLESIEEMAGIDVLACDKTGTLTKNQLRLGETFLFKTESKENLLLCAALATEEASQDPIDLAILQGIDPQELKKYTRVKFVPFDPVRKRADSTVRDSQGNLLIITKGAPQVICTLAELDQDAQKVLFETVDRFAQRGERALGVAQSHDGKNWQFLGVLSLSDPLREDSAETIRRAQEHGIVIKMLTGDNLAIAKEISRELDLGEKITLAPESLTSSTFVQQIEESAGFAQIFPEHKYQIVKTLQSHGHIVGMTGDGVNDSPALKQADVGIAVSESTDAARAASSLVLLIPGLSVIILAIEESRCIFERMNSYAIYRITETIRIMLFMVASILVFNFYPVTAVMIILLALLNDIPILAIAYDNTLIDKKPVRWNMHRVLTISTILGCIGVVSTFLLLFIVKNVFHLSIPEIQSFIFLKLSVAGHQTLFLTRTRGPFFSEPYPSRILFASIVTTQIIAALFVGFGIFVTAIPWFYIGLIWAYTLVAMFVGDAIKVYTYKKLQKRYNN